MAGSAGGSHRSHALRNLFGFLIGAALALVFAILVVPPFLNINRYHARIQAELERRLGRTVSFGDMHAWLLPPSVELNSVVIGEDPRFGQGPFASAETVSVTLDPWALIHKQIDIQSFELRKPQVELIHNAAGVWNFASLGQSSTENRKFELADFRITNGQVQLKDEQKGTEAVYDNIDLRLQNYVSGNPFHIDAALHLPGKGTEKLDVSGEAGPMPEGTTALIPFNGDIKLDQVSLADLQRLVTLPQLESTQGIASGSIHLRNENASIASDGTMKLEQAVIRGVDLGYLVELDYKLSGDLNTGVLHIEHGTLHIGPTPISVSGMISTNTKPLEVDLNMTASNASISEAARLASGLGMAFNPGSKVSGTVSADVHAKGPATAPELNGTLAASGLSVSGGTVKEPVQVPKIELTFTPTTIRSNPFTATSGGTSLDAQFTLADYTSASPNVVLTLKTANAKLGEMLSMARAYGAGSLAEEINGSGTLTLDLIASGPLKNTSAMTFTGNGELQNASLTLPSLAKPVNVRKADIRFDKNSMVLQNMSASLDQTNATGNVTIRNFAAPQVQFTLAADRVNLASLQQIMVGAPQRKKAGLFAATVYAAAPAASPLSDVTGSGSLSLGTLTFDDLVMNNVRSQVSLDRGVVRLAPVTSSLYNGQETGEIDVDTRTSPMAITVSSKVQKVDANQLLSSISNMKQTVYGQLAANTSAKFQAQSAADIARTLNGTLSLDLTNGRLMHMDVLNELASIGRFLGGATGTPKPFTNFVRLDGTFDVTNGLAHTADLTGEIPGAKLTGEGNVNLATDALDLHVTAVLAKQFSQAVGGTQIGGFMQTVLANNNGELVVPFEIEGSVASPHFEPDVAQMARLKVQNLAPTFSNPQKLTGLLGSLMGNRQGGNGRAQGLGGLLRSLGGQQNPSAAPALPQGEAPPQRKAAPQPTPPAQPQNPLDLLRNLFGEKPNNQAQPAPQPQPAPKAAPAPVRNALPAPAKKATPAPNPKAPAKKQPPK